MTSTTKRVLLSSCLATLLAVAASGAPPPAFDAERAREAREAIAARRAELAQQLSALEASRRSAPAGGAIREELDEEIALVERLDRLQADQTVAILNAAELSQSLARLQDQLAAGPRGQIPAEPPFGLALFDTLWDALDAQRERLAQLERSTESASQELDAARQRLAERERARREAAEALARGDKRSEVEQARLQRAVHLAELESQLADGRRELGELALENARRALEIQRRSEALVRSTVEWVEERLAVSDADLREPLERIAAARYEVERALGIAKRELEGAERRLLDSETRAESQPGSEVAAAELAARQEAQAVALRRVDFLEDKRARLDAAEEWWQRRVEVLARTAPRSDLRSWVGDLDASIADRRARLDFQSAKLAESRQEVARLEPLVRAARRSGAPSARWLDEELSQVRALADLLDEEIDGGRQHLKLLGRVREEIARRTESLSPAERFAALRAWLTEAWNAELTVVDDRSITPGKIVTALVLLALGVVVSRRLADWVRRGLRRRTRLDEGAAVAFQSLSFYALMLAFVLLALDTASIPLTVFTFVGGALAIGVGFGSQNIVNNFISGLILLVERPIKVGDLVQVEGTQGYVESIGARSTIVRTFDNTNIIVPNSTFLETNVINWTLSDQLIRTNVSVGVAYGSPVREVERLLQRVMDEHPQILERPAPFVRFVDFGDNALVFTAYFWLLMSDTVDRRRLESDLRFRIDETFREAGIEIAFPQRDLHWRSGEPVRVRIEPAGREEPSDPGSGE